MPANDWHALRTLLGNVPCPDCATNGVRCRCRGVPRSPVEAPKPPSGLGAMPENAGGDTPEGLTEAEAGGVRAIFAAELARNLRKAGLDPATDVLVIPGVRLERVNAPEVPGIAALYKVEPAWPMVGVCDGCGADGRFHAVSVVTGDRDYTICAECARVLA